MTTSTLLSVAILAALGWVAVCYDLLFRRIPNGLVVAGIALGLVFQGAGLFVSPGDGLGLGGALLGGCTGLLLFLPLVALRAMGAGDAKLLAMAGVWLGAAHIAQAALWTLLAGGVLALATALHTRVLRHVLANIAHGLMPLMAGRLHSRAGKGATGSGFMPTGRLPYAVAIFAGTACEVLRMVGGAH